MGVNWFAILYEDKKSNKNVKLMRFLPAFFSVIREQQKSMCSDNAITWKSLILKIKQKKN